MTLASLMTESVQILRRTVTGEDSSGNEIATYAPLATVNAYVSRRDTSEDIVDRDQVVVDYSFMLPAGTDVRPYDRLIHLARTFEVVGLAVPAIKPGAGEQFRSVSAKWVEG